MQPLQLAGPGIEWAAPRYLWSNCMVQILSSERSVIWKENPSPPKDPNRVSVSWQGKRPFLQMYKLNLKDGNFNKSTSRPSHSNFMTAKKSKHWKLVSSTAPSRHYDFKKKPGLLPQLGNCIIQFVLHRLVDGILGETRVVALTSLFFCWKKHRFESLETR